MVCWPILLSFFLATATVANGFQDPPPTPDQEKVILDNIAKFAERYVQTVPNLICLKTVEQYHSGKKAEHWKQLDTLQMRLSLVNGEEKVTLLAVNSTPLNQVRKGWVAPLTTADEFGSMLRNVMDPVSDAKFEWQGWETVNSHHVAVFKYSIDKQHSTVRLSLGDLEKAVLPYSGSIYADADDGTVWRISEHATEIPPQLHTSQLATTMDYEEVTISGQKSVLPVHATVVSHGDDGVRRNEITFSGYRRFAAESTIKFGTDDSPSQAPSSQK